MTRAGGRVGRFTGTAVAILLVAGFTDGSGARPPAPVATPGPSGRVLNAGGGAARGAMVTATLEDGRSVTVYTGEGGRFTLPEEAEGASTLVARLPGEGWASLEPASGDELVVRLQEPDPVPPPGAAWVAGLPAGEPRRRFIVDCTGCHVTDASRTEVDGTARDSVAWHAAVARMVASFGPGTGFPIISGWADPASLSGWLTRSFAAATPRPVPLRGPAEDPGAVLTEFPVPVAQDLPHDLRVDRSGTVLVTGMFTHRMYRLDPATGAFATTPIPEPGANPRALDLDDRGRWWVVLSGPGKVAVYDPTGDDWTIHDVGMYAHGIALGPRGRAWVNGHFTHDPEVVAGVDVETGDVTRYTVPPAEGTSPAESTIPYGLRVGPDGAVWGTQLRGNHLVRLDPESGEVRQWPMPVSHAGPRRLDLAGDGSVWIPLYGANALARFDPVGETFRVWDFPVEGALPYVARVDGRDGRVWLGTGHGDVVACFDPATERFTLYPLPTRGALIRHLDVDEARGEVWFAYGASPGIPGKILRLRPGR